MLTTQHRVMMYERSTDRVGGIIDVPKRLIPQILSIAGIVCAAEPGESELTDKQTRAIARVMNFRADVGGYHYHLETRW
jgi:hypothetical protein